MAELRISLDVRNRRLNAVRDAIDAGGGPAIVTVLDGNTVLGTLTMSFPCSPAASGGKLTFLPIAQDPNALNKGTANRAVIATSEGDFVLECDVTPEGKGGLLQINDARVAMGGPIRIDALVLSEPE